MKSLSDRRRLYMFLRVLAGSVSAFIVWGLVNLSGFISVCAADDPDCQLYYAMPAPLEQLWRGESGYQSKGGLLSEFSGLEEDDEDDESEVFARKPASSQNMFSLSSNRINQQPYNYDETSFLAHAPGFSVIQNAYWRNETWYFITSKPWSFPDVKLVVTNGPDHGQNTKTDDSIVRVASLAEAKAEGLELDQVDTVQGTSLLFNDRIYYHVVGEMFLGAWRAYTSILYGTEDSSTPDPTSTPAATHESLLDRLPEITRLVFAHVPAKNLFDHAGLNKWFFSTSFPHAEWEFEPEWQKRANSGKWYRFEHVIIADRKSGHAGGGKGKPMDLAFELPVPDRWVTDLKDRLLASYTGPVSLDDPGHAASQPVITYISRQTAVFRRLKEEVHEELVAELKELEEEGLAEVQVEEFTDADPKDEQVAKLSRTTASTTFLFPVSNQYSL
ncbi:hypothetical protein QFC22_003657 [Naganishia vaughanmartiniae]|uniref:Uncharacterized protein n=1 Tax=Naganishia vaughanmartiniae TaxID=1424756 RepID=A0ACC2X6E1_9TREE|nr:hypothetical protein QFC22_003657 [Naganishia vaughanmartiniae]